jgi:hypothetical protein
MKNIFKPFSIPMHSMPKYPEFNILKTEDFNLATTQDILDFLKESGIKIGVVLVNPQSYEILFLSCHPACWLIR